MNVERCYRTELLFWNNIQSIRFKFNLYLFAYCIISKTIWSYFTEKLLDVNVRFLNTEKVFQHPFLHGTKLFNSNSFCQIKYITTLSLVEIFMLFSCFINFVSECKFLITGIENKWNNFFLQILNMLFHFWININIIFDCIFLTCN